MIRGLGCCLGIVCVLWGFVAPQMSFGVTIDFESVPDLTGLGVVVDTQFAAQGVLFTHAIASTDGISLGPDFPPHSGATVVSDDGEPMLLTFAAPFLDVGGFFTYNTALTLSAFDPSGAPIPGAMVTSAFSDNTVPSGNPPNEFLHITGVGPIGSLRIAGSPTGFSFTLDDFSATAVPEPHTILLLGGILAGLVGYRVRQSRRLPQ